MATVRLRGRAWCVGEGVSLCVRISMLNCLCAHVVRPLLPCWHPHICWCPMSCGLTPQWCVQVVASPAALQQVPLESMLGMLRMLHAIVKPAIGQFIEEESEEGEAVSTTQHPSSSDCHSHTRSCASICACTCSPHATIVPPFPAIAVLLAGTAGSHTHTMPSTPLPPPTNHPLPQGPNPSVLGMLSGLEAAVAALHILTVPGQPHAVYDQDLIEAAVEAARFQLAYNVFPFHDARLRAAVRPQLGARAEDGGGEEDSFETSPKKRGKKRKAPSSAGPRQVFAL